MQNGYRFRIYPNKTMIQSFLQWIGCQDFIYNSKVAEDLYFKSFNRKFLVDKSIDRGFDQSYAQFKDKELTPWLFDVPSVILRNGSAKWMQSYARFFKGLAGRPTFHSKHGKRSVWITSELFEFKEIKNPETNEINYDLFIGNKKHPIGNVKIKAHRKFKIPNSIHISVIAGKWFVSFNNEIDLIEPTDKENLAQIKKYSEKELLEVTCGIDRGVSIPFSTTNKDYLYSPSEEKSLALSIKKQKIFQKKMAKRFKKGQSQSNNYKKAKNNYAKYSFKIANIRNDFAHKVSHNLANSNYQLFVLEDLKLKNMTKSAKGTIEKPGKNISQKKGLNKALLNSSLGQTAVFLEYKARRKGKYVIKVNPKYSSQECSNCGTIHKDNRKTQERFICISCGLSINADKNANINLAKNGVGLVLSKEYKGKKDSKKVGGYNKKTTVGQGMSNPSSNATKKLVGDSVRLIETISIDTSIEQLSKNQETPSYNSIV